jgi:hypothetical protein
MRHDYAFPIVMPGPVYARQVRSSTPFLIRDLRNRP